MPLLSYARTAFALLFLAVIFCGSAWNLKSQGRLLAEAARVKVPRSVQDIREVCAELQALIRENAVGKYEGWAVHAFIQEALGKSEAGDFAVVKAEDGRLYEGGLYPLETGPVRELAEDVAALAVIAREKGARVLYLNAPDSVLKNRKILPANLPYRDYNTASDVLLQVLREKGVPRLDARHLFIADGFPPEEVSPKTSRLLGGDAAFALFGFLLDGLERQFSLSLDPDGFYRDKAQYAVIRQSRFFMGEYGKRTGPAFAGLDDFTGYAPEFDTEFAYEGFDMFGAYTATEGDAATTLLNPEALVYFENLYRLYPQSYYRHTNAAWSRVVNQHNPGGPKLLIVHDFYTAQLVSHLAPLFGEIQTLSNQANVPMNAASSIRDNDFDYVLVSFFPGSLLDPALRRLIGTKEDRMEQSATAGP